MKRNMRLHRNALKNLLLRYKKNFVEESYFVTKVIPNNVLTEVCGIHFIYVLGTKHLFSCLWSSPHSKIFVFYWAIIAPTFVVRARLSSRSSKRKRISCRLSISFESLRVTHYEFILSSKPLLGSTLNKKAL